MTAEIEVLFSSALGKELVVGQRVGDCMEVATATATSTRKRRGKLTYMYSPNTRLN